MNVHATGALLNITKFKSRLLYKVFEKFISIIFIFLVFLSEGNPVEILVGISVASFSSIKEVDMVIHFKHFGLKVNFL